MNLSAASSAKCVRVGQTARDAVEAGDNAILCLSIPQNIICLSYAQVHYTTQTHILISLVLWAGLADCTQS